MAHQVIWTKAVVDEFIRIGGLTEFEELVLRTRVKGYSVTRQAIELNVSESTIARATKRLKIKYDNAAKYSKILPPRAYSYKETYK